MNRENALIPTREELLNQLMLTIQTSWKEEILLKDIELWLSNFNGEILEMDYERNLALLLLNNFVYYNLKEVRHLCKTIFGKLLHYVLANEEKDINNSFQEFIEETRFCYLGNDSESGSLVSMFFRQSNKLANENFLEDKKNVNNSIKRIVFVDDVTLSGEQFLRYLRKSKIDLNERESFLLTFFSTPDSMTIIEKKINKVITATILDERNKIFSEKSVMFHGIEHVKNDCEKLAMHYGLKIEDKIPLGWGNGQYAFGFFYNVPDNVLPIFWSESNNWKPIMKRFHKKYDIKEAKRSYE